MSVLAFALLFIGTVAGYGIAKFFAGKNENVQGRWPSIIFRVKEYKVHLHHWMWGSACIVLLLLMHFRNSIVYGLLIGIVAQGLNYSNRFRIIYKA